jgi:putative FmdB family regulatory protein
MPIYEYHCPSCGKDFELFVRGETKLACTSCNSRQIERRMSLPARPAGSSGASADYSKLGPPKSGGGCTGGGCGCH